jgi:urease accessory protein
LTSNIDTAFSSLGRIVYAAVVLHLNHIVGNASDGEMAEKIHRLSHSGSLEKIELSAADTARKRLRVTTDKGTDCAIALNREISLENGSVLLLEDARAIVVRMLKTKWLRILPADKVAALELGYFVGNLHWRVHFNGEMLEVALEGPEQNYLDRLAAHMADGRARRVDSAKP